MKLTEKTNAKKTEQNQALLQNTLKKKKQGRARRLCPVVGWSVLHVVGGPTRVSSLRLTPRPYAVRVVLMPYAPSLRHACRPWACHVGGGVDTLAVVAFGLYAWRLGCKCGIWAVHMAFGPYSLSLGRTRRGWLSTRRDVVCNVVGCATPAMHVMLGKGLVSG